MNLKSGWMRCPDCSGHGPYDGEAGDKCKTCDGSGTIKLSPAAPESETPETDALIEDMLHGAGIPRCDEWDRLLANAKKFERQHSLAQTEIKGHMRVVDELQARIAELERILRLYQGGRRGWEKEGMLAGEWLKIQEQFDAAVNEVLKDRA